MFEQRGSFSGLDTCNHVEFGRFDSYSLLRNQIEDRCIYNRYDINTHLDTLVKAKIISSETADNMRENSQNSASERRYKRLYKGATFIPVGTAIDFQEEMNDRTILITHDNNTDTATPGIRVKITRYWPLNLYPCQNLSLFGVQTTTVPSFRGDNRNKMVWKIAAMMSQVECVWKCFANSIDNSNQWQGWFLSYLTKECFNFGRRQHRKDPFKLNQIRTIEKLRRKIPANSNIRELIKLRNNAFATTF